jgi:hypothetical protein
MKRANTLQKLFTFPGFRAKQRLSGMFGDPMTRMIDLERRKKGRSALAAESSLSPSMIESRGKSEISRCSAGAYICALRDGA